MSPVNSYPIGTITLWHRLRYLGVKIYPICVLAGTELQARVDGMGGARVFFIIGHIVIIIISISSRRQTCHCSRVCGEREEEADKYLTLNLFLTHYWLSQLYWCLSLLW